MAARHLQHHVTLSKTMPNKYAEIDNYQSTHLSVVLKASASWYKLVVLEHAGRSGLGTRFIRINASLQLGRK